MSRLKCNHGVLDEAIYIAFKLQGFRMHRPEKNARAALRASFQRQPSSLKRRPLCADFQPTSTSGITSIPRGILTNHQLTASLFRRAFPSRKTEFVNLRGKSRPLRFINYIVLDSRATKVDQKRPIYNFTVSDTLIF